MGKALVEQVDGFGNIVIDCDTSISRTDLYERIKKYFPKIHKSCSEMICGEHEGKKYAIRVKNITYLGNPHPIYKKRIQIPDDLRIFYDKAINMGCTPILLGVYTYGTTELFCDFNIDDFICKKAHNSSAHVYTSDMANAVIDGIFQKIDYFGNKITVFRPDVVNAFLDDLFENKEENIEQVDIPEHYWGEVKNTGVDAGVMPIQMMRESKGRTSNAMLQYTSGVLSSNIINIFKNFFESEDKVWNGINCYQKMIKAQYKNKYQPEWAGFFLEYEFEKYINENSVTNLITYAQDKSKNGIDLDLYFPTIECYGDLKAHSDHSSGIQGNDWETVFSIIGTDKPNNHIFYIVCEHGTIKDSERNYEVTHYWNQVQGKADLMSYSKRMKNQVILKKMYILDINSSNKDYLSKFKQGINSNGKLRAPKIMIERDNLNKFILFEMNF